MSLSPAVSAAARRRVSLSVLAPLLALAFAAFALAASGLGARIGERLALRSGPSPAVRAAALARLVAAGAGREALASALAAEREPLVLERALDLAAETLDEREVASLLAARLAREGARSPVELVLLRGAAAQADERALPAIARALEEPLAPPRVRAAAFTALAATTWRLGRGEVDLPRLEGHALVGELAESLDEEAPEWRVAALRALARRARATPAELDLLRARLHALDDRAQTERLDPEEADREALRAFFVLRGDPEEVDRGRADDAARTDLLAPDEALAQEEEPDELDALLLLESWGGGGAWRSLEGLVASERGRAQVRSAVERARAGRSPAVPRNPAGAGALVLLARAGEASARPLLEKMKGARAADLALWARAALGELALDDPASLERLAADGTLERLPPPLVRDAVVALGARATAPLVRASGSPSGRLARVLEPGAGSARERALLDLAVLAARGR